MTAALAGALLAGGMLALGTPTAQAAAPAFPSWLVGYTTYNLTKGASRLCSAIELSETRELTGADCFTGHTSDDRSQWYHGGRPDFISQNPAYRVPAGFVPATRQSAFGITEASNTPVSYTTGSGRPTLATTGDAKLYAAGATATFYSWAGLHGRDNTRTAHTEQVSILSAGTCAAHLGHPQAPGTFCTLPKPGTAKPDHAEQCAGDAGGALMAGGKLIGLSATSATGCVAADGVRVYANITAYRAQILAWSRDVFAPRYLSVAGSVTTQQEDAAGGHWISWQFMPPGGPFPEPVGLSADTLDYKINYTWITQAGDLDGDGLADVLARTPGGALYRYPGQRGYDIDTAPKSWLANGFAGYTSLFATDDFSGDGLPDLLARDTAGKLWLYKGNGKGGFAARVAIGTGWKAYTLVTGRSDLSGDGRADIIARDSGGTLWLFRGNGKGGYSARTKMGTGFNAYKDLVTGGDMDNDGRQDILGRTPGGGVFLLNADNKGGLLPARHYTQAGWKPYSRIS
ncbi:MULTISPECIES: FG-GAP repeat domain-containing protein [unclassified Streptomyces]|uniref:FG-GAP repeat domain-containing protein n=1 Tax=unclassified Streptomyces TaxID=2593676 RepID=UPI000B83C7EB|nr:VCBS repeat-containing protein [Streptomyces sp. DvalAA-14]